MQVTKVLDYFSCARPQLESQITHQSWGLDLHEGAKPIADANISIQELTADLCFWSVEWDTGLWTQKNCNASSTKTGN